MKKETTLQKIASAALALWLWLSLLLLAGEPADGSFRFPWDGLLSLVLCCLLWRLLSRKGILPDLKDDGPAEEEEGRIEEDGR